MKYCQKTIVVIIILLWCCCAGAQEIVITGIVCDEDTKLPITNVHVYLDGTSVKTITNNSGRFELKPKSVINAKLVIQHLSYETAIIDRPFEGLPDTLYIKDQIQALSEVTISADRFSRRQKMKAFREQFLGMSRAGRSCTIVNEDDIQLYFNMQSQKLLAFSDKPIEVVNDYLGYRISFLLVDFWVQYGAFGSISIQGVSRLDNDYVQSSYYAVYSSFSDIDPNNSSIKQRRDNVNEKSTNYFFKSFAGDALTENQFTIFNNGYPVNYQDYFSFKDTLSHKMISIIPDTDINTVDEMQLGAQFTGSISVLYRKNDRSDVYFMTDSFLVDRYGNIDKIDQVLFNGRMGSNRAGDMLPIDYEP